MSITPELYWKWVETYLNSWNWPVLPLRGPATPRGLKWTEYRQKFPTWAEWQRWRREYGMDRNIQEWGIGLLLKPANIWILDIDDGSQFPKLLPHLGGYLRLQTRRGYHIFMRAIDLPDELKNKSVILLELLDVEVELHVNTLSPLPPSPHRKDPTFRYRWEIEPPWNGEVPPPPTLLIVKLEELSTGKKVDVCSTSWPRRKPKKPAYTGSRVTEEEIISVLEELGISYKHITIHGIPAIRPACCPLCLQRDSGSWVWASTGVLRCFAKLRCPAGQSEKGLPFEEWVELALSKPIKEGSSA